MLLGRLYVFCVSDSFNDDMCVFFFIVDVLFVEKWVDSEGFNNKDYLIDNRKFLFSRGFLYGDGNKEYIKVVFLLFGIIMLIVLIKSEDFFFFVLIFLELWGGDRLFDKFN